MAVAPSPFFFPPSPGSTGSESPDSVRTAGGCPSEGPFYAGYAAAKGFCGIIDQTGDSPYHHATLFQGVLPLKKAKRSRLRTHYFFYGR